jgi:hypothetical protein
MPSAFLMAWTLANLQLQRLRTQLQWGLRTRIGESLLPDLPFFGTEAPWSVLYDAQRQWSRLSVC